MILGIVFIVVFLVVAFVASVFVGGQNPPTSTNTNNSSELECDRACQQWEDRRLETCQAKRQTSFFQSSVDGISRSLRDAIIVHLALVAAAVAAAFIPIVGQFIAIAIAAAAMIALTFVHALAGQLAGLNSNLTAARRIEQDAMKKEVDARKIITDTCTSEKANQCLSRPSPC